MQSSHRSRRILLPAKTWFIYLSLAGALLLAYIPFGRLPGVPDWVALVLVFWSIREPLRVGMGAGFLLGILADFGQGAAMGQHALAYVLLTYTAEALSRRVLWFGLSGQALHVLPMLLASQILMTLLRMLAGDEFPGWGYFLGCFTGTLLWAPLSVLLLLPQYQPVVRDENRPI